MSIGLKTQKHLCGTMIFSIPLRSAFLSSGKPSFTKTDDSLEKFQKMSGVTSDPKIILQISFYIEDIFCSKMVPKRAEVEVSSKICNIIFLKKRGESNAVWNFSENSSVLVNLDFPQPKSHYLRTDHTY